MITRAYPLRMLVHSDAVGAIIGRSGSTIKTITHETEAKVDVHREDSPEYQEKVITINGSPESCSEACYRIIEIVQNEINAKYEGPIDKNRDLTLKILASSNLIGRLIGKNGSSIKKIMEQTSTRVNISENSITATTGEHTIVIVGKLESIRQAERLISFKLRTAYMSDMNSSLQTMSQQPYLFNNVLLPYMPNPYAQNSILASIVNPQAGHGGGGGGGGAATGGVGGGGPGANSMPRSMPMSSSHQGQLQNSMYTTSASGYLPMYPAPNMPTTASGLLGFNPVTSSHDQERETVYVYIPSSMVGAIIGKSGSTIKEMIITSGASIKVATLQASELDSNGKHKDDQRTNNSEPNNSSPEESSTQSAPVDGPVTATTSSNPRVSRYPSGAHDSSQQSSTRKVTIVGYPASQYSAQYMIFRKISIESKGDISLMVEIYVPSQVVGRIIGKGGSTIKNLQKQTRTSIRLPDDKTTSQAQAAANTGETCIQITGEFEASQAAQRNIRNMVRESLYTRQTRSQHQTRNNESNLAKNNAQTNNHQDGDSEHKNSGLCNADDKTTNEKGTDKTVHGSPSMSSNDDRQKKQQEGKSQNVNSSSPVRCDERPNGADNNNTIINNLNSSSKHQVKDMKFREQTGEMRDKEDCLAGTEWRA